VARRRARRRLTRRQQAAALAVVALAWGWATHPVLTVLAVAAATAAAVAWWSYRRDANRRQLVAAGQQTFLYRHFGWDGRLLYVGITNDYGRRCAEHSEKWWWPQVDPSASTVQVFPNRLAALRAEKVAIRAERPVHNIAHNGRRLAA
jgi:predicted GIY-YIG superfamily endonuclease